MGRLVSKGVVQCKAPLTYSKCSRWQDFSSMSPAEKEEWQHLREQNFPCKARDSCQIDWTAACPADWYAVDGGLSCIAPDSYKGNCSSELSDLESLSEKEKMVLAGACSISWPCQGEASEASRSPDFAKIDAPHPEVGPAN